MKRLNPPRSTIVLGQSMLIRLLDILRAKLRGYLEFLGQASHREDKIGLADPQESMYALCKFHGDVIR